MAKSRTGTGLLSPCLTASASASAALLAAPAPAYADVIGSPSTLPLDVPAAIIVCVVALAVAATFAIVAVKMARDAKAARLWTEQALGALDAAKGETAQDDVPTGKEAGYGDFV